MSQEMINKEVEQWAQRTVATFANQLKKRRIGVSGKLLDSFVYNITKGSDGNIKAIELKFLFYGRFVDMGVGKGSGLSLLGEEKKLRGRAAIFKQGRKPKKWYSRPLAARVKFLSELLQREFGLSGVLAIESQISGLDDVVFIRI